MTLLEQAKKLGRIPNKKLMITSEHIEVALAWAKGDIGLKVVMNVMNFKYASQGYGFLAMALKEYVNKHELENR